jgi:hypothetical protein
MSGFVRAFHESSGLFHRTIPEEPQRHTKIGGVGAGGQHRRDGPNAELEAESRRRSRTQLAIKSGSTRPTISPPRSKVDCRRPIASSRRSNSTCEIEVVLASPIKVGSRSPNGSAWSCSSATPSASRLAFGRQSRPSRACPDGFGDQTDSREASQLGFVDQRRWRDRRRLGIAW